MTEQEIRHQVSTELRVLARSYEDSKHIWGWATVSLELHKIADDFDYVKSKKSMQKNLNPNPETYPVFVCTKDRPWNPDIHHSYRRIKHPDALEIDQDITFKVSPQKEILYVCPNCNHTWTN